MVSFIKHYLVFLLLVSLLVLDGSALGEVLINEVELNPPDNGSMWVELFNGGQDNVSIGGWQIVLISGARKGNIVVLQGTVIGPDGFHVEMGQKSWFPMEEGSATLINASGAVVDETPILRDSGGNTFTNSRVVDGKDTGSPADWGYMMGSKGGSNGRD